MSYGQFEKVFEVAPVLQNKILDSISFSLVFRSRRDSVPIHLEKLKLLAKERKDYRFQIMYEICRMRYECHSDSFDTQKESDRFNQLLNIAREKQDTVLMILMSSRFADILRDKMKFASSISYYLLSYKYMAFVDTAKLHFDVGYLELELAVFYYHLEDYKKALDFISNNKYAVSIDHKGMTRYDLWSQICLKLKDYECSKQMIQKAYNIYLVSDTNTWLFRGWNGIFKGNLGKIEYDQQNYAKAIPLFKEGIRITAKAELFDNVASFGLLLIQSYIHTNQASKALELLPMVKSALSNEDDPQLFVDYFKFCLVLSNHISQAPMNLKYLDSLEHFNNILLLRKNKDNKIKEDLALEISSQELFQAQLEQKITRQLVFRNTLIGFVILVFIAISRMVYLKQKQLLLQKKLNNEISLKAEEEITAARKELDHFKEFLLEKNSQIISLESSLNSKESQQDIEDLKFTAILTDEDWVKFKSLFNNVYPNYMQLLKANYPQLTQGEIRYFLLQKLNMNNKEMASILGVSPGAMRTIKSRIYKKLGLDDETRPNELMSIS